MEPNRLPNLIFSYFLAIRFSSCVLASILDGFRRLQTSKNKFSLERGADFGKIDVFKNGGKQISILDGFWEVKTIRNQRKIVFETNIFPTSSFLAVCCDF